MVRNADVVSLSQPDKSGAADRAYQKLVRLIATCELAPGEAFNERDQAAALGMSRTPLRQALHRLALEDLVVTVPLRGVFVSLLDPKLIRDNTVVREALEVEMLREVVINHLPVDYPLLKVLLDRMQHALEKSDDHGFLEADEEFHFVLAAASGNRPALEAIHRSWIHVNRVRYLERQGQAGLRAALGEHRAMVTGVRKGDPERVEKAVRAHMNRSRARLDELTRKIPDAFVIKNSEGAESA
jgi:GntR family transcriptional regulator, rspAB operon transcriptional repressor